MTPALLAALWTLPGVAMLAFVEKNGPCKSQYLVTRVLAFVVVAYLWPLFLGGVLWLIARDAWAGRR